MENLDTDVEQMTVDQLRSEVVELRAAIRKHRDCSGHDLCWYHPELWEMLPEGRRALPVVPPRDEFLRRCGEYRDSLGSVGDGSRKEPSRPSADDYDQT